MHCQDLSQLVSAAPERASALPDALREHADQCLACQAQVHASQRLTGILAEAGEGYVPAPGLARQVLREVDARRKRPAPVRIWAPLASTLVLALCVGGTVWFAGSLGPQSPATAPEPSAQSPGPATGTSEPAPELREHPGPTAAPVAPVAAAPTEHALKVANAEVVGGILETGKAERRTFVLSDGTTLSLNHDSRVRLLTDRPRALELVRGEAVLDVIKQEPLPPLLVELPTGTVRVVGTRLMVSALADRSVVDVLRGKVIAMNGAGSVPVTAGREAVLKSGVPPRARPAVGLAGATRWADVEAPAREGTMGIGTLTARRPGAKADTDQALRLTDHRVSLTTRGQLARTQIEEAFANDTAHTMEGIYSFPLPADARIAGLELLVDGTWMPGAMVARDRGDKIWAGVIRNATPKAQRKNNVEFVWIPGPWRDPAILNWKEGSRFELKIFPIPAHGERRVRIAYTQTLKRTPNGLRYVYPLADGADQAVADRFRFDARLGGVDSPKAVRSTPYEVESRQDDDSLVLKADIRRFRPRGDLVVDLPDPTGDEELRSWAYVDPNTDASYALLALRPELPAPSAEPDTVLFVVDASYSTQAERLNRAARLVSRVVGELSRTTEVAVLACATECRRLGGDFRPASSLVAADLQRRIGALQPLGATRLTHAVKQAATTLRRAGRETRARVVYIGDGMPSVGEIDPARIAKAARRALGDTPLTTVSTGGEVDDLVLRSLAEETGGARVAHEAGDTLRTTAFELLARLRFAPLRDVELSLPTGLRAVAPATIGDLWPGDDRIVTARLDGDVTGDVVLRGTIGGEPFERKWRVALEPTTAAGNSFLPRVWAERRIDDLQRSEPDEATVETIVKLSRKHHVLSRYTSLLVLESEAMHRAFGVEHTRPDVEWTGSEEAVGGDIASLETREDQTASKSAMGKSATRSTGNKASKAKRPASQPGADGFGKLDGNVFKDGKGRRGLGHSGVGTGGAGRDLRSTAKRETRVKLGQVRAGDGDVGGALSSSAIQRVIRRHQGQMRAVYERQLKSNPNLKGKANVSFTIGGDGRVTTVEVSGSVSGQMRHDLARVVRRWRFPAPSDGQSMQVRYPFVFSSSVGEGSNRGNSVLQDNGLIRGRMAPRRRGGQWVPMRKVWYREAVVRRHTGVPGRDHRELERREERLDEKPDSRDRTRDLVRWYVRTGDLAGAERVATEWLDRDRLDAGALVALSDIASLRGNTARSQRLLASAVDADPRNPGAHRRMMTALEALADEGLRCEHALTLALHSSGEWTSQVEAARCGHDQTRLLSKLKPRDRKRAERAVAKKATRSKVRDKLTITAEWDGDEPLDIVVVTPRGRVVSFLGGAKRTRSADADESGKETLAMSTGEVGRYQIFVVHRDAGDRTVGKLRIKAHGRSKTLRFSTDGKRSEVGVVTVERKWRHERI